MQKNDSGIKSNSTTHGNPDTWCDVFNDKQLKLDHLLQGKISYYVQSHTNKVKYSLLLVPPWEKRLK